MKVTRPELCDHVCLVIGIVRKRKRRPDLSRRELERLVAYLEMTKGRLLERDAACGGS